MNPARSNNANLNNYKTRQCRHYDIGKCKLGALCNFAHGNQDVKHNNIQDSMTNRSKSLGRERRFDIADTYEKILLLENRMEATYSAQRALIGRMKQVCQSQAPSEQNSNMNVI